MNLLEQKKTQSKLGFRLFPVFSLGVLAACGAEQKKETRLGDESQTDYSNTFINNSDDNISDEEENISITNNYEISETAAIASQDMKIGEQYEIVSIGSINTDIDASQAENLIVGKTYEITVSESDTLNSVGDIFEFDGAVLPEGTVVKEIITYTIGDIIEFDGEDLPEGSVVKEIFLDEEGNKAVKIEENLDELILSGTKSEEALSIIFSLEENTPEVADGMSAISFKVKAYSESMDFNLFDSDFREDFLFSVNETVADGAINVAAIHLEGGTTDAENILELDFKISDVGNTSESKISITDLVIDNFHFNSTYDFII